MRRGSEEWDGMGVPSSAAAGSGSVVSFLRPRTHVGAFLIAKTLLVAAFFTILVYARSVKIVA